MLIQPMELVWPAAQYLSGYVHALQQGWSPDNLRPQAAADQLARIAQDPARFLSEQVDREAKGPPVIRGLESPRFRRIETLTPKCHVHHFRIESLSELDKEVESWLREAYQVGTQEHLSRPKRTVDGI